MSSNLHRPTTTFSPKTTECDTCACPSCGGLECLCRPRFFAGQLLTDDTFNSLDRYIIEKNKLHNRYLHGWGVVCGLEVVCGPCNEVTVRPGYALSPCGEDVIVCNNVAVNICELINKCKGKTADWECEPFPAGSNADCRDQEEDWVLTVRYDERGSRGITALKASSGASCCSSCNCGGSSSCGCGCKGKNGNGGSQRSATASTAMGTGGKYNYRPAQQTVAAQCEPTLTCEGYVFEVAKPLPENSDKRSLGALIERISKCFKELVARLPQQPGTNATIAELHAWCCSLKEALRRELLDHPVYNCGLSQALADFSCPNPSQFQTPADYRTALDASILQHLSVIGAEYVRYCICSAFLPPCPEVVCDPRVPIATITVRKDSNGNCRIVRICNLGKRKFVTTFVSLGYWLSFLRPLLDALRRVLETLCCRPFIIRGRAVGDGDTLSGNFNTGASFAPVTDQRGFRAFANRVWANRGKTIDAQTLFLGAIGARNENAQPYLAKTELENPFFTVMVNNMAGPLLAKLPDNTPDVLKRTGRNFAATGFTTAATSSESSSDVTSEDAANRTRDQEISDLKTRLSELHSTVAQQSETIDELRKIVNQK